MLLDLQDDAVSQAEPDLDAPYSNRAPLMTAVDARNDIFGRRTVSIASAGFGG